MKLTILIVMVLILIFVGLPFGCQKIYKANWNEWEYRVQVDHEYWFTNAYTEENGCIEFINNYGDQKKYCEKYQVGENYWKNGEPTFKTMYYGTN